MASLNDAVIKLERAKEQLEAVYQELVTTLQKNAIELGVDINPYPAPPDYLSSAPLTAYTAYFKKLPKLTKRHGAMIGEAIQSFRIALDYLAWAFAMKHGGGLNAKARKSVYYPMAFKSGDFKGQLHRILPHPSFEHWAFFQCYQPYRRSNDGRSLRHLGILSTRDKHRVIVPTLLYPAKGEINFKFKRGTPIYITDHLNLHREVNEGTKIRTIIVSGATPPQENVHVDLETTLVPIFPKSLINPSPPYQIISIEDAMDGINQTCTKIIAEAKNCF